MTVDQANPFAYEGAATPKAPSTPTVEQAPWVQKLVATSMERSLTSAERLKLATATFTTDPALEIARCLVARHPDEAWRLDVGTRTMLDPDNAGSYEAHRRQAIAAGRSVAAVAPGVVARIDAALEELRATDEPPADVDEARRQAFGAALVGEGLDAALPVFRAWLADLDALDAYNARRVRARATIGLAATERPGGKIRRPAILQEIEWAVGGRQVIEKARA